MCRSSKEGGQRCPGHAKTAMTRAGEQYVAADAALQAARDVESNDVPALRTKAHDALAKWKDKQADYASTPEGETVLREMQSMYPRGDWRIDMTARAITEGLERRERNAALKAVWDRKHPLQRTQGNARYQPVLDRDALTQQFKMIGTQPYPGSNIPAVDWEAKARESVVDLVMRGEMTPAMVGIAARRHMSVEKTAEFTRAVAAEVWMRGGSTDGFPRFARVNEPALPEPVTFGPDADTEFSDDYVIEPSPSGQTWLVRDRITGDALMTGGSSTDAYDWVSVRMPDPDLLEV
jgi:hypothetical protein